jgi:hypothetical protein
LFFNNNKKISIRPNGIRFIAPAGTTEFVRRWNPQPGDIVSFKHRGYLLSTNKPKLPTLTRMRTDMTWEDVMNNWKEQKHNNSGEILEQLKINSHITKTKTTIY